MRVCYDDLLKLTSQYIHAEKDQSLIKKAFMLAESLHEGVLPYQQRNRGIGGRGGYLQGV